MDREQFIRSLQIEGLEALIEKYAEYDRFSSAIQGDKGFKCIDGCGACCMTSSLNLEVSVFEMLPLAIELFRRGLADEFYDRLEGLDTSESVCVIYHKLSDDGKRGYCSMHPQRPLICRMFGGGIHVGKAGKKDLLLCRLMKDVYLPQSQLVDELMQTLPMVRDYCTEVRDLNPDLSQRLLPINEAIRQALDLILTKWYYASMEGVS